jgi:hypothetical protein
MIIVENLWRNEGLFFYETVQTRLTACIRDPGKPTVTLSSNSEPFTEPGDSLTWSYEPATGS